ncbi:MAG: hypothetical protein US11_C0003G0027 [Candidatus Roizmanbacteria bacterium GW2011_GWA2_36_23]|uniref:Glycosyltransferase subfamily 4-like N-terminal domain-containing protein n=1 Tax=Candidatus Roizmanbacteria bacterium GW2011_GWA2_36_23 TaxID=1618480 RepID=A0A0G0GPZ5_9BACT|nr:MAG: hypothetical protein US11_C0003G0027 [Candidatus Roizmanbacteria bacterium GW2011_GWA2_36_23]
MLTPYVPYPPSSGGQIRTLNLLKYLCKKHHITLVSLYKNDEEKRYLSHLRRYCKKIYLCRRPTKPWQLTTILKAVFSFYPFLIVRNFSQEAHALIKNLLHSNQYDVIHAETFYVMPHIPKTNIPVILAEQTIEYKVYQHFINSFPFIIQLPFYLDIAKLKFWEKFYWRKARMVASVSESDQKIIKSLEPGIKTSIVPNGAGDEMIAKKLGNKKMEKPTLLFLGNYNWLQNVEAAYFLINKIYPELKKKLQQFQVIIAGQNAHKIKKIPYEKFITLVDLPSNDTQSVKKLFNDSTLFLAPIFGPGGTRLKILAAMASGAPVISTKTGVEGLDVKDGKHVLIAQSSEEFIKQIMHILANRLLYQSIQKDAYLLVKQKYSWIKIAAQLEIIYETI